MNTTMAIRIHALGGPEMLRWEEVAVPDPGPGEVLVRHEAVGLNFIDTYHRSGLYPVPSLPTAIGMEAAGVVEAVGPPVGAGSPAGAESPAAEGPPCQPGDRVAYGFGLGAYCERRVMPAGQLVPIPDGVDFETAAAAMLKGMTSWYLCRRTYRLSAGETVLVHAAAGGVGTILSQWCKALGATVIGTAGSAEKGELAGSTAATTSSSTRRRTSSLGCSRSPGARASPWSSTESARPPLTARWSALPASA